MKNLRKKRYFFLLIGLGIILWISINWLMKSEAEKMVISCRKIYRHTMKLEYVIVDEDKKVTVNSVTK